MGESYRSICYWNTHSYGKVYSIDRSVLLGVYTALAIIIPIIIPLPFVMVLRYFLPKKIILWSE